MALHTVQFCAFVFHVYILYVPSYLLIRQDYLFTMCFWKDTCNTSEISFVIPVFLFLVPIFLSLFLSAFHLFDVIRAQTDLGPKNGFSENLINSFLKDFLEFSFLQPTLTHVRLPEKKVRKVHIRPSFKPLVLIKLLS